MHTENKSGTAATQYPMMGLDEIGNRLLSKGGVASAEWLRYYQPTEDSKWHSVPEAQAAALSERIKPALVATCSTNYKADNDNEDTTPGGVAYYLADWVWFDIDCDEPADAIEAAHKFVRKLEATSLDLRCLRLYASGKKGFHVFVPMAAFVDDWWDTLTVSELRWFPDICRRIAQGLYVQGLDLAVYSARRGRQFRQAGIQRKIGTYKVPLTLDEFWGITPDLYAEYVSSPRPAVDTLPPELVYDLATLWDDAAAKAQALGEAEANITIAPVTAEKIERMQSLLDFLPPDEEDGEHTKHELRRQAISATRLELGADVALPLIREWVKQSSSRDFTGVEWRQMFNASTAKGGNVTALGTLIARAQRKGWIDPHPELNPRNQIDSPAYRLKETDEGFSEHVAALYGDRLRYVAELKAWAAFDGRSWVMEHGISTAKALAKQEARAHGLKVMAAQPADDKEEAARKKSLAFATGLENGRKLENIVGKMADDPRLVTSVGMFDDKPYLVNLVNGTYDLERDEMRGHEATDYLTQRSNISRDPSAQCSRWLRFVDEITCGNKDLATYLQCIAGLCLSGDVSRQEAYLAYGPGANGKTVFTSIIRELCGDYFKPLDVAVLVYSNKPGQNNTEMAALRGARAVATSELERGVQLRSGNFKDLTGGDAMQVSDKYIKAFTLKPQCTILIPTNHLPTITENDHGTWRRIRIIPFRAKFEGATRDPNLMDKLRAELPGILNWAIDGFRLFRAGKMETPLCVQELSASYRDELNIVKNFTEQWLVEDEPGRSDRGRIKLDDLYVMYQLFCKASGLRHAMTKRMFKEDIGEYLPNQTMQARQPVYQGWRIRTEYVPENVLAERFSKAGHAARSLQHADEVLD